MAVSFTRRNEIWALCEDCCAAESRGKRVQSRMRRQLEEFFATATPEELHVFVSSWNWDAGLDAIRKVIEHSRCDAGTALKAFWLASPEYFLEYASREEVPEYHLELFDLVNDIQRRFLAGEFKTAELRYRPRPKKPQPTWQRSIPDEMYQAVGQNPWWAFWR